MPKQKKYKWSEEKSINLIKEYINRPILWERKSYGHSILSLKEEAWASIAKNINENVYNCKSQIKCMLSRYRFINSNAASDRDQEYKNKWFAYKYFQQLYDKKLGGGSENLKKLEDEESEGTSKDQKEEQSRNDPSKADEDNHSDDSEDDDEPLIKVEMIDIEENPITYAAPSKANSQKRKLSCDTNETEQKEGTSPKKTFINEDNSNADVEDNPDMHTSASKPNLRARKHIVDTKETSQKINIPETKEAQNQMKQEVREFSKFVARKLKTYPPAQYREVEEKIREILLEADQNSESIH